MISLRTIHRLSSSTEFETLVRELLEYTSGEDYTIHGVARLLDTSDPPLNLIKRPAWYSLIYGDKLRVLREPLAVLASLFWFNINVPRGIYVDVLPSHIRSYLSDLRFVVETDVLVFGELSLVQFGNSYFFSDQMFVNNGNGSLAFNRFDVSVTPPHESSIELLHHVRPLTGDTTLLDVGCGSGFLSVLLAPAYVRATAIDVKPRAIGFTRLNARINERKELTSERADIFRFGSMEPRLTYDHVLFNAPWGPEHLKAETDPNDNIVRVLRERLPVLLSAQGLCQIFALFLLRAPNKTVEDAIRDSGVCDAWRIAVHERPDSPFRLAPDDIRRGKIPRGCYLAAALKPERLAKLLQRESISEVRPALIDVWHKDSARPKQLATRPS